jgi:hypothetical protein
MLPHCHAQAPFLGFAPPRDNVRLPFYQHDDTVAHLHEARALPRIFSVELFGEVFARRLDALWAVQQLGASDEYAPQRVRTLPRGDSVYEAEMLLEAHFTYPAPFFARLAARAPGALPGMRAIFGFTDAEAIDYDAAKKAMDGVYFAFAIWLEQRRR